MQWNKDPQAILDYSIEWSTWLVTGETISTSTWTVPAGLTKVSDSKTTTATTVWLSGGTVGTAYTVTCHIKTSVNREDDRSFIIVVEER